MKNVLFKFALIIIVGTHYFLILLSFKLQGKLFKIMKNKKKLIKIG